MNLTDARRRSREAMYRWILVMVLLVLGAMLAEWVLP